MSVSFPQQLQVCNLGSLYLKLEEGPKSDTVALQHTLTAVIVVIDVTIIALKLCQKCLK